MKNITIICFKLLLVLCSPALSQTNDCVIFNKVLQYIDNKEGEYKYFYASPQEGINPTNPVLIREKVTDRRALHFCIVNEVNQFSESQLKTWFAELLKDTILFQQDFIANGMISILNCNFDTVKYHYANFGGTLQFVSANDQTIVHGAEAIHYSPAGIIFSNILYSKEGYAAVYVKLNRGLGFHYIYGFLFENTRGIWILKKVASETL